MKLVSEKSSKFLQSLISSFIKMLFLLAYNTLQKERNTQKKSSIIFKWVRIFVLDNCLHLKISYNEWKTKPPPGPSSNNPSEMKARCRLQTQFPLTNWRRQHRAPDANHGRHLRARGAVIPTRTAPYHQRCCDSVYFQLACQSASSLLALQPIITVSHIKKNYLSLYYLVREYMNTIFCMYSV